MKKISTVQVNGNMIFKGHKLTLGMDLGDHSSCYCVLDEAGKIILEQKVAMTPEAMKQTFSKILRCADTGTAGANRSGAVGAGAASQCASANPPDGDPGAGRTGKCSNGLSERSTRVGEVLWAAATQVWHTAGEPGAGRGIARGVA